jgi:ATP-dependent DNA helicase RecQ
VILALLKEWGVIRQHRPMGFSVVKAGLEEADLKSMSAFYEARDQRDREKLDRMTIYAQTALCRWKNLTEYFGEDVEWLACGNCDNCARQGA